VISHFTIVLIHFVTMIGHFLILSAILLNGYRRLVGTEGGSRLRREALVRGHARSCGAQGCTGGRVRDGWVARSVDWTGGLGDGRLVHHLR
jgi:hypothetical protein